MRSSHFWSKNVKNRRVGMTDKVNAESASSWKTQSRHGHCWSCTILLFIVNRQFGYKAKYYFRSWKSLNSEKYVTKYDKNLSESAITQKIHCTLTWIKTQSSQNERKDRVGCERNWMHAG